MKTENEVYLVLAYRLAPLKSTHPIGIFTTKQKALDGAEWHRSFRASKYEYRIYPMPIDSRKDSTGFFPPVVPPVQ